MNLLLLGGNSQRNQTWIHNMGDVLSSQFDRSFVHDYKHWRTGAEFINFDFEMSVLPDETKNFENYAVFAKSIGSVLTLKCINSGILKPSKCIFIGLPIKAVKQENIDLLGLLKSSPKPTLIIQNSNDPLASFSEVQNLVEQTGASNYKLVELAGDTHNYDNLDELTKLVADFKSA